MGDQLRGWLLTVLALAFVLLYAAALVGWLKPLPSEQMVARLEPLIFVIVGYYFGRLPSQQTESTLKEEIHRQTQRADAAQHAKEQMQQSREALEEKVKGLRAALTAGTPGALSKHSASLSDSTGAGRVEIMHHTIATALHVLNT